MRGKIVSYSTISRELVLQAGDDRFTVRWNDGTNLLFKQRLTGFGAIAEDGQDVRVSARLSLARGA